MLGDYKEIRYELLTTKDQSERGEEEERIIGAISMGDGGSTGY
jgi:hypothetical protein